MTKPIRPTEIAAWSVERIPDRAFEVFNDLLVSKALPGTTAVRARITEAEAVDAFARAGLDTSLVRRVARSYSEYGWFVSYDRPGYNESYGAFWELSAHIGTKGTDA